MQVTNHEPVHTNIFLKFEDHYINKTQYTFFQEKLGTFKYYIHNEYILEYEIQYNESLQLLSININIKILNHLIPTDPNNVKETINDIIYVFKTFYEVQTEIYIIKTITETKRKSKNIVNQ